MPDGGSNELSPIYHNAGLDIPSPMNPIARGIAPTAFGRQSSHLPPLGFGAASGVGSLASRRKQAERCRSMALVITLAILVLMTLLVIAFLSTVSLDRQATANYARSLQADSIALGGLDLVVSQLQAEIADPANSTTNGTMYVPMTNTNAVPQRMSTLPTIITFSGTNVYSNAANLAAPGSYSTNASLNNRFVSMKDWYQPDLTLTTNGFPVPQWILVTRNGTYPSTWNVSLANHALGNGNYVVGRYAYVVYDTGGLIDVNVAGYPSSAANIAANKGIMPWVDLTQLTNAVTQADVDNLVNWRNAANSSAYASYVTNWATNGFMQVAPGDTTFLGRQELIKYAQTQNTDLTNALPFLTTFSRELNGPTWGPETNMGTVTVNGTNYNYNYQSNETNAGSFNPLIYNPLVLTAFTRNNGVQAVPGEPLVKYRFPLDKLALLEKMQGIGTLTATDVQQIQQYFGLDLASDVTATSGYYRHWNYPTTNSAYPHGQGTSGATGIMSLSDVAAQNREPDFFELLQAGILQGSLGVSSIYQSGALQAHARSDFLGGNTNYLDGISITDVDQTKTYQILRIGANIIDQWHADNYPTAITYLPSGQSVYGICDLPYITALFLNFFSTNMAGGTAGPPGIYICPQIWNPHQPSGAANTPTQFQIAPDPGDEWNIQYYAPGSVQSPTVGAIFKYNANNGTFPVVSVTNASAAYSAPFGATNSIVFTASSSAYRDPSMITNATSGNATNPWSPSNPTVGAIQIDNLPLPASTNMSTSDPVGAGFTSANVANALPTNSAPHGSLQLTWAQATNNANYTNFGAVGDPIYEYDWGLNGVFVLEYYNPANNTYYPYSTFEGFANSPNLNTGYEFGATGEKIQTNAASGLALLAHVDLWVKSDPRTFRFGPGRRSPNAPGTAATTADPYHSIFPTTTLATNLLNQAAPFASGADTPAGCYPYRFDMWAINDPSVAITQGQTGSIPTNNVAYYTDPDGAYRYGDSHYSYTNSDGYATPFLTGATTDRPVILHRPFRSVGELGYVFRDDPWRTLDLFSPGSADAGLLDLFSLSDGQAVIQHNGQQTVVTAGRVNPNTPYPQVLAAMMMGTTQNIAGGTALSTNNAFNLATSLVTLSSNVPLVNRADLVTRFMTNATFSSGGLYLKGDREAVIRSLAESSNTRTWNFLIDIDAQSGIYPPTATSLNNFVVGGERHYWLHVAIDRYTGQVIDRQLEMVNQ